MGELSKISIALLGGSTSGKTTFFAGIYNAFMAQHIMINGNDLSIIPKFLNYGTFEDAASNSSQPVNNSRSTSDSGTVDWNAEPDDDYDDDESLVSSQPISSASESAHSIAVNDLSDSAMLSREMEKLWSINQSNTDTGFQVQTATTRYVELICEVRVNDDPKCSLVITDYAGELLDLQYETSKVMLGKLAEHIQKSNAAIVLANSQELNHYILDEISQNRCMFKTKKAQEAVQAVRVNALMNDLKTKDYCFLISLTQCDSPSLDERMKGTDRNHPFDRACNDLASYIFQPAICHANNLNWSRGVIPVSAISYDPFGTPVVDEYGSILSDADIGQWHVDAARC